MTFITLPNGLQFIVEDEEDIVVAPLATVSNVNDYSYIVKENSQE